MQRDGKERIPGSIDNYVTGVSERSQQSCNLKDDRYIQFKVYSSIVKKMYSGMYRFQLVQIRWEKKVENHEEMLHLV